MIKIDLLQQKHLFKYYDNVWKKQHTFYITLNWNDICWMLLSSEVISLFHLWVFRDIFFTHNIHFKNEEQIYLIF